LECVASASFAIKRFSLQPIIGSFAIKCDFLTSCQVRASAYGRMGSRSRPVGHDANWSNEYSPSAAVSYG
jgi:hypothetical protein